VGQPRRSGSDPTRAARTRRQNEAAPTAADEEAAAYEREYPGSSWLASMAVGEIVVAGTMLANAIGTVTRRYGLSNAAANALAVVEGNAGPLAAGDISARMQITSGTMTTVLDTLERKGLIERAADRDDRRRVMIDITTQAQDLLDRMLPEIEQVCTLAMAALDKTALERVMATLQAVRRTVDELPDDLPAPKPRRTPRRLRR
jgi:DNA-binding MarR family transcriptional regulator